MRYALCVLLCLLPALAGAQTSSSPPERALDLLPQPQQIELREGRFLPRVEASVSVDGFDRAQTRELGELAVAILREGWDVPVKLGHGDKPATLSLQLRPDAQADREGYTLDVDADSVFQLRPPQACSTGCRPCASSCRRAAAKPAFPRCTSRTHRASVIAD